MTRTRRTNIGEGNGALTVKQEPQIKEEPESLNNWVKQEEGISTETSRKRKHSAQYQDLDSDEEDSTLRNGLVDDDEDYDQNETDNQVLPKKKIQPRHVRACQHYRSEFRALPDPRGSSADVPAVAYIRSMDLVLFLKGELDYENAECKKMRKSRKVSNAKLNASKKELIEVKIRIKAAETKADVLEKQVKDLNMELTSKLARPLSHAQIKLENVHDEYSTEMTTLRTKSADDRRAKEEAETRLKVVQAKLADIEAQFAAEVSTRMQVDQDLEDLRSKMNQLEEDKADAEQRLREATSVTLQDEQEERFAIPIHIDQPAVGFASQNANSDLQLENHELKLQIQKLQDEIDDKEAMIQLFLKRNK